MEDYNWLDMMEKMNEIRLFSSLHIRGKRKGATSPQEIDMLSRIFISDEAKTPLDLSVLMGLSKSAVSRLIESLEKKEFLEKQYSEKDKRSYTLYITEKGHQELQQASINFGERLEKNVSTLYSHKSKKQIVCCRIRR